MKKFDLYALVFATSCAEEQAADIRKRGEAETMAAQKKRITRENRARARLRVQAALQGLRLLLGVQKEQAADIRKRGETMTARFNNVQKRVLHQLTSEWKDVGATPMQLYGLQTMGLVQQRREGDAWQARLTQEGIDAVPAKSAP